MRRKFPDLFINSGTSLKFQGWNLY
jgi:hypothetical protein